MNQERESASVAGAVDRSGGRILDPIDRNSEVLFGLFMVLTFTGTLSVTSAGQNDVRTMMLAALGCNVAWGFVDGVMYVIRNLVARGRQAAVGAAIRASSDPAAAHRLIADEFGPLSAALKTRELENIRQWVVGRPPATPRPTRPTAQDLKGAVAVFLLVFASTVPVVLPFVFIADLRLAMRVSGAIAIALMFRCGYSMGTHAGASPWRSGMFMVLVGVGVEAIVIALGG
jgi:hypothetical protein